MYFDFFLDLGRGPLLYVAQMVTSPYGSVIEEPPIWKGPQNPETGIHKSSTHHPSHPPYACEKVKIKIKIRGEPKNIQK